MVEIKDIEAMTFFLKITKPTDEDVIKYAKVAQRVIQSKYPHAAKLASFTVEGKDKYGVERDNPYDTPEEQDFKSQEEYDAYEFLSAAYETQLVNHKLSSTERAYLYSTLKQVCKNVSKKIVKFNNY